MSFYNSPRIEKLETTEYRVVRFLQSLAHQQHRNLSPRVGLARRFAPVASPLALLAGPLLPGSRRYRQHDLPDMLTRFHQRVRGGGFGKRKHTVNHRLDFAAREERPDVLAQ